MNKLIITASPTDNVIYTPPEFPAVPRTAEEIATVSKQVRDAGASVVHLHGPWKMPHGATAASIEGDDGGWGNMTRLVRAQARDIIVQYGVAGAPIEQRKLQMEGPAEERPDMVSVGLGCHDYQFGDREVHMSHARSEYVRYAELCVATAVRPEFELFHLGNLWNFHYVIEHARVQPERPYWFSLFLGVRGGSWSPPTTEELNHRLSYLPEGCNWQVVPRTGVKGDVTIETHRQLLAYALLRGGHVRVGIEDNPYLREGVKADSSAQLVEQVVDLARSLGREVATPDEARTIIGLSPLPPV